MRYVGTGVLAVILWAWMDAPWLIVAVGAFVAGALVVVGLGSMRPPIAAPEPSTGVTDEPEPMDPAASELVAMGFPASDVIVLVRKARAAGDPDPKRYVMRSLIK